MTKKKSFNVAVFGAGAIGLHHLEDFKKHPAARVVALAEVSPERGREAAERHSIQDVVTDYRLLLARPEIDVVSIALPNYLHAPVALDALRAGKHVMLDKPMATNAREAAQLVKEADKRKLLLMVGQNQRFIPEVQVARQLIQQGVLGDIYHAKTGWCRRAGIPRIGSWFTQKKFAGGGATYDIGVHALDRALYLMDDFEAAAVSGQTYAKFGPRGEGESTWGKSEISPEKPFDVDDFSIALIKMKSGRTVLLEASWAAHQAVEDVNSTQLFGTEAGLQFAPLQLSRLQPQGYTTETITRITPPNTINRMYHFIDCLLGNAKPLVTSSESIAVQKILDAIYLSAKTGREVRLK